ncbi:class I SAM-dependent methyltransferase [Campylobacter devanensis]|uniref:class I SAM-dependent methyltransferase n=1 Tax=Campylobacter devanensis TaxID=3161138 RepID=UPI000A34B42E|nr:class I SAM-dependent methyltransferase [Campylobacter sp. P0139]
MSNYISNLKGFKYPDSELIRYFFKNHLNIKPQKVLELGCNNGNNLALFASYDYEVTGVELDAQNVENANFNFSNVYGFDKFNFINQDMREFCKNTKDLKSDVLLIPNVINYITKSDFIKLLENIIQNKLIKSNSNFFIRARSLKDHRYGLGKQIDDGVFILDGDEYSGEKGIICSCYKEYELVEILKSKLNLRDFTLITSENLNVKSGVYIKDSDIIIYGKIN